MRATRASQDVIFGKPTMSQWGLLATNAAKYLFVAFVVTGAVFGWTSIGMAIFSTDAVIDLKSSSGSGSGTVTGAISVGGGFDILVDGTSDPLEFATLDSADGSVTFTGPTAGVLDLAVAPTIINDITNLDARVTNIETEVPVTLAGNGMTGLSLVVDGVGPNLVVPNIVCGPFATCNTLPGGNIFIDGVNISSINITGIAGVADNGVGESLIASDPTGPIAMLVTVDSPDGSIDVTSSLGTLHLESNGVNTVTDGGAGTSLIQTPGQATVLRKLTSTDGSIAIVGSGSTVDLSAGGAVGPTAWDFTTHMTFTGFTGVSQSTGSYRVVPYGVNGYTHRLFIDGTVLITSASNFGSIILTLPASYYFTTIVPPVGGSAIITFVGANQFDSPVAEILICANNRAVFFFSGTALTLLDPGLLTVNIELPVNLVPGTVFDNCAAAVISDNTIPAWNQPALTVGNVATVMPNSRRITTDDSMTTVDGGAGSTFELRVARAEEWGGGANAGLLMNNAGGGAAGDTYLLKHRFFPTASLLYWIDGYVAFSMTLTGGGNLEITWNYPDVAPIGTPGGSGSNRFAVGGSCTLSKVGSSYNMYIAPIQAYNDGTPTRDRFRSVFASGVVSGLATVICTPTFQARP